MDTLSRLQSGQLAGATRLDLSCGLTQFPSEIFELADTLEVLNLTGNQLSALPDDLHRLRKLRVLFCSDNAFTTLPESIGACPSLSMVGFKANQIMHVPDTALPAALRWLILTDNRISAMPRQLGQCTQLEKLMLAGNALPTLPEDMAQCHNLALLRIAANQFTHLPAWLRHMPKLAWLAWAGNPMSDSPTHGAHLDTMPTPAVPWQQLRLHTSLGEGASGVIHAGTWSNGQDDKPVAIKLFKGAMTSDGLPQHEMQACLAAGHHPQLIPVWGQLSGHPEGEPGLVMHRVDARFKVLAGPPSLSTCTRDVYSNGWQLSADEAWQLGLGMASVLAHLHQRGIQHGDVYAHNILWPGQGPGLLGDFGAASFLPVDVSQAQGLQRLEARAYACLLEELLAHCPTPIEQDERLQALARWQTRCGHPDVDSRPLMQDVNQALQKLDQGIKPAGSR
jgi:hypothetical protein